MGPVAMPAGSRSGTGRGSGGRRGGQGATNLGGLSSAQPSQQDRLRKPSAGDRPPARVGTGVFVLGTHRAGTSAFAGAIAKLGVAAGPPSAMKPASTANEMGFWELEPLTRFNDELLAALGGGWASPPALSRKWHLAPGLEPLRRRGRDLFHDLQPSREWMWKDPRNSVVLPFWLSVLRVEPLLVIAYRNPLEVQLSLARRDGFPKLLGLALWERYMRAALLSARGRPTLVASYAGLIADPRRGCERLLAFLGAGRVECPRGCQDGAAAFLKRGLRHARRDDDEALRDADVSDPQRRLWAMLTELEGEHERLPVVEPPPETPMTEELLAVRRDADLKLFEARASKAVLSDKLAEARARSERLQRKLDAQREKLVRERREASG